MQGTEACFPATCPDCCRNPSTGLHPLMSPATAHFLLSLKGSCLSADLSVSPLPQTHHRLPLHHDEVQAPQHGLPAWPWVWLLWLPSLLPCHTQFFPNLLLHGLLSPEHMYGALLNPYLLCGIFLPSQRPSSIPPSTASPLPWAPPDFWLSFCSVLCPRKLLAPPGQRSQ